MKPFEAWVKARVSSSRVVKALSKLLASISLLEKTAILSRLFMACFSSDCFAERVRLGR